MPTDHAARAHEVHVATDHEVRNGVSGDHVKQSQGADMLSTSRNLVMWDDSPRFETTSDDPRCEPAEVPVQIDASVRATS